MAQLGKEYVIFTDYQNTGRYYLAVSTNGKVVVDPEITVACAGTPKHIWYKVTANDAAGGSSSNSQQQEEPFVLVNKTRPEKHRRYGHDALVVKNISASGQRQVVLGEGRRQVGERWTTEPVGGDLCYIQKASDPRLVFDAVNTTDDIIVELSEKPNPGASNPS